MSRQTYREPNGRWGVKGISWAEIPDGLYGALYKLMDYYKAGGFCRYGGDEPANVCVLGPCAHEVAAHEFIAETVAEKGGRDHPDPPEPLTQEQLREMVGHWVWVLVNYEHNGEVFQCDGWALVATPCRVAYLDQEFPVSELGTRFQAYTQPVSDFRVRFMNNREGMAVDEESE